MAIRECLHSLRFSLKENVSAPSDSIAICAVHLLAEGRWSWWNGGLPHGWSELEINISSSRDFCNEVSRRLPLVSSWAD